MRPDCRPPRFHLSCPAFAFSCSIGSCYKRGRYKQSKRRIDQPEPRWQALLAFVAVAAIYLALPRSLIVGPTWLLPTLISALLVPTVVSHRLGRLKLNRILGLCHQLAHHRGAHRFGRAAGPLASVAQGAAASAFVFRRASLAHERHRLRPVVLADRRRRFDSAPRAQ